MTNWIVIPAHNCLALTKRAVASCFAQTVPDVAVWLIDNDSTDGTANWANSIQVAFWYTHFQPALSSVAATWNFALNYLFRSGAEHVLVINNDVELRPDAYELLLKHGGPFVTCVGVSPKDWERKRNDVPAMAESPHPDFSCFLIRKPVWETVGRFNEECLIAYAEDSFYHIAMHRDGIKAISIDVPFLHYASGTLKSMPLPERERIRRQADRNRELFRKAYGCLPGTVEYEALFTSSPSSV